MKRIGTFQSSAILCTVAFATCLTLNNNSLYGQGSRAAVQTQMEVEAVVENGAIPTYPGFVPVQGAMPPQTSIPTLPGCNGACDSGYNGEWATPMASQPMQYSMGPMMSGIDCDGTCDGNCSGTGCRLRRGRVRMASRRESTTSVSGVKTLVGVDETTRSRRGREPGWKDQHHIPWEAFAYGEYIGPHRTAHVGEYRLRVNDQLEFVYLLTRERTANPYQLFVGDVIQITSAIDTTLNQKDVAILSDGTVSLNLIGQVAASGKTISDLQERLNEKYSQYVKNPAIVVQVTSSDTPLRDLIKSVDATAGQGGQLRQATVAPDGTVQLPLIGSIPAIGLTLEEIRREVNARYRQRLRGIEVTPVLVQRAPRFVFVVGEVGQPGRFELNGPTTAIQSLALAEGPLAGGNLRQIVVFRRDHNWRLMATRLDLAGAFYGRRPHPSDDVWLRDSDIVMIPKKPIQRVSEAVNLYFTQSLFGIFPAELGNFDAGQVIQ